MFSFGDKKEKEELADWTSGDETGLFHTMQDDLKMENRKDDKVAENFTQPAKPYLEQKNNLPFPTQNKEIKSGESPFLGKGQPIAKKDDLGGPADLVNAKKQPKIVSEKEAETPDQYLTSSLKLEIPGESRPFSWVKALFIISSLIVAAGAFFWGYTIWMNRQSDTQGSQEQPEAPIGSVQPENNTQEEPIIEEIPQWKSKFSTSSTNYWIIPIETVTAESMGKLIREKAKEADSLVSGDLAEFIITDSNNNPISFSAFCILSGITLPSQIFESLEEDDFLFYLYKDGANVRTGLSVKVKNADSVVPLLSGAEKNMAEGLKPLLLGEVPDKKAIRFSDGKYKNYAIRYFNLNTGGASIDYSISESNLVIATSMMAERAILDKAHQ